ncbi:MAG: Calx-beta domain-containing protein, partial [Pyrinomonadaceae bacterium]
MLTAAGLLGLLVWPFLNVGHAAAAGDNGRLVFAGSESLHTINPDGSGQTRLISNHTGEERYPAWSPDATKIVFCRRITQSYDIFVVNADGSNEVRLTNTANAASNPSSSCNPSWSPDGAKIAFVGGGADILVMNADGSGIVNLTNHPATDVDPAWSPDGTRIAFASLRDFPGITGDIARGFEIYSMNTDGSNVVRLTNNQFPDSAPSWSPDTTRLAFTRREINQQTGAQNVEIYAMNADGSGQTNLTNHPSSDFDPSWSPDGARIAFITFRDAVHSSNTEIYMMDADGSFPTRITNNFFEDREPNWGRAPAVATPTPTPTPAPTPAPTPSTISGRITDGNGNGLAGVTVILITNLKGSRSTVTQADGSYTLRYLPDAGVTVSPARTGTAFSPAAIRFVSTDSVSGDKSNINFTGTSSPAPANVQFSSPAYSVLEGSATAIITVTRSGNINAGGAVVSYRTLDDRAAVRCDAVGPTAYARCDYATTLDTIYFGAGETEKTFTVSIINDGHVENAENIALELFNPIGATLGVRSNATLNIADNDTAGAANPIDDSRVFVRQQYLDFLSREPESAGFQSWLGVLSNCSDPFNADPN